MKSIKEEAFHAIATLPDNTSIDDIMYRLYVIDKIHKGQMAILNGDTISSEELEKEMQTW